MAKTVLDLTGLKCPLPVLKTRKALPRLQPGDLLEVRCTDPMALIDIPVLIGETGDRITSSERSDEMIVFVIEKLASAPAVDGAQD
ncbi:sulfurtransferase TusA family protein [Rhodopseudomonas sp. BR0C11]|uniref:sulfurtransferase TusA family protein n=1 Tax=Rhodopseudomonas sp. BR0C11 TaxID=2269370 RepID=UPI0013E089E4|nr:sulfurtransferase TusA family protein [Rhodopseudomonas sp. BR0C11]NEV77198.1 sulfurtransferase TusA family protein [Rhodopseudomonas sp. BR0C11]